VCSPNKLLRSFPALNAEQIKNLTVAIIQKLPEDVYAEIVDHAK
jgi:cell cycle arrest protein BUB2